MAQDSFDLMYTRREVTALRGLALLKRMINGMRLQQAIAGYDLPVPGSNQSYAPAQLVDQLLVSIWFGATSFCHTDITGLDATLTRLFEWPRAPGHKAIVSLFQLFNLGTASRLQMQCYDRRCITSRRHCITKYWRWARIGIGPGRIVNLPSGRPLQRREGRGSTVCGLCPMSALLSKTQQKISNGQSQMTMSKRLAAHFG